MFDVCATLYAIFAEWIRSMLACLYHYFVDCINEIVHIKILQMLIVLTFEETGIFMLGLIFLISQTSPIEIKKRFCAIENVDFPSSNLKRYFL